MKLNEVKNVIRACVSAGVVPSIAGHKGIGKTQVVHQVGKTWQDRWSGVSLKVDGQEGIPVFPLYCATQDVADLIGFPIQVWESNGSPVVKGIASTAENDRIVTSWAEPMWVAGVRKHCLKFEEADNVVIKKMIEDKENPAAVEEFRNRPKAIIFLDEIKRAPREVLNAMYPFILDQRLHEHIMPKGTRIVTADNFAGAYDLREPDEAFMSRFCHIEAECDIKTWHTWATDAGVVSKIRGYLSAHSEMLNAIPKDWDTTTIKYVPLPDPRRWALVDRLEKYGRSGLQHCTLELQDTILKKAIFGIIGMSATEGYWKYSDKTVSVKDILTHKKPGLLAPILAKIKSDVDANRLKEKLQIEASSVLKGRKYNEGEAINLKQFLLDLNAKERATGILQTIFQMKNSNELDGRWTQELMKGKDIMSLIQHLLNKKNV